MATSRWRRLAVIAFALALGTSATAQRHPVDSTSKLDPLVQRRAAMVTGRSQVIIRAPDAASLAHMLPLIQRAGGTVGRHLPILDATVATLPNVAIRALARNRLVERISLDRPVAGAMDRTGQTTGAASVRKYLGYDGDGIGVAVIDSGITAWHDDLGDTTAAGQRVGRFVDFVQGRTAPYDDYGHGTHVAGIIAGNGFDSDGARSGIAPRARLTVLKVLDAEGRGRISDVIAALDYIVRHRSKLGIRVVNLSVSAAVHESFETDPLTLATRRAVEAGLVVVAAAGNAGRDRAGRTQYGAITAPGNAPWVLTVGTSSHMGTPDRTDDVMAKFSSRGPTAIDAGAKPDVVAPGVGIESLSDPDSVLYAAKSDYLLKGTVPTAYLPYLSLSGSSMATPVVTGTVALMLQANPDLTPNQAKAIVQYTAEVYPQYDPLTGGAGFLNARGAVQLARHLASPYTTRYPDASRWGAHLIWGNRRVAGGQLTADANAWSTDVMWGARTAGGGQPVAWGVLCGASGCNTGEGAWEWDTGRWRNVVWGSACGGDDCEASWSLEAVAASTDGDTVVWGTSGEDGDTVVWGTNGDGDTVVWGTDGGDTVVWGTTEDGDTVVWGTSCTDPACEPVIWTRH